MCDEYWERELAKRWKLLAAEDETIRLPVLDEEKKEKTIDSVVLPPLPALEEKKRSPRLLAR